MGFWYINKPPIPGQMTIINFNSHKSTCHLVDNTIPVYYRKHKRGQLSELCQRAEEARKHMSNNDRSISWKLWNSPQEPGKETGGTEE